MTSTPPESVDAIPDEEVEAACRAYRDAYPDGTSRAGQQGMRAALMADRSRNAPDTGGTWRPIETAPKGEQWKRPELLLWDGRNARVGCWDADEYAKKPRPFWSYRGSMRRNADRANQPTHWMPLPAAPGSAPPAPVASPAPDRMKPHIEIGEESGITTAIFEDVAHVVRPVIDGIPHWIDGLYAMDDGRLVGMQVWATNPPAASPACGGEVEPIVPNDRLEELICRGTPSSSETHDMAVELLQRRSALASPEQAFQARVDDWLIACFGEKIARDKIERNHRFLEESLELVQSNGCTASEAHQLVDYVFNRPVGELKQEVGGVMNTLAALCLANGISMDECGETELARVWTKVEKIRAKQAAKPKHSPLPEHVASPEQGEVVRSLKTLIWAARTSGGTAGPDPELVAACENAEATLIKIGANHAK